ncbi:MAG: hypothetical protein AMXMBFR84_18230 [Candidatus Hydrogenedentota bacterium]
MIVRLGIVCLAVFAGFTGYAQNRRAIIVVGGTTSVPNAAEYKKLSDQAYSVLKAQGYTDANISFLSPHTTSAGRDGATTSAQLQSDLTSWAASSTLDLVLYLIGPGTYDSFQLNATESISSTTLDGWLDTLQTTLPNPLVVIMEFDTAGAFLDKLRATGGKVRINIATCDYWGPASFLRNGRFSFSIYFWSQILYGSNVNSAFNNALDAMTRCSLRQTPLLDDDGDGEYNAFNDGFEAQNFVVGNGTLVPDQDPSIGTFTAPSTIQGGDDKEIRAENVVTFGALAGVEVLFVDPDFFVPEIGQPFSNITFETLAPQGGAVFNTFYDGFEKLGVHRLVAIVYDVDGRVSHPFNIELTNEGLPGQQDLFEDDDAVARAYWYGLGGPRQHRNFHDAGDVDWVVFFGRAEDNSQGDFNAECVRDGAYVTDCVLELYDGTGTTLLDSGDGHLEYETPPTGKYALRIRHKTNQFGPNTYYELRIWRFLVGPAVTGNLQLLVQNASNSSPVAGAEVNVTKLGEPALNFKVFTDGLGQTPQLSLEEATYQVNVAKAPDFTQSSTNAFMSAGATTFHQVMLNPVGGGGLTVTSPNGGETLVKNAVHNIQWTGASGNVKIVLLQGAAEVLPIAESTANTGSFAWTVPGFMTPANDYRVQIYQLPGTAVSDISNNFFSIAEQGTTPPPPGRKSALEKLNVPIAESTMPANPEELTAGQPLSLRVSGHGKVDPATIWMTVEGDQGYRSDQCRWQAIAPDNSDGWITHEFAQNAAHAEALWVRAGAVTSDGAAIELPVQRFVAGGSSAAKSMTDSLAPEFFVSPLPADEGSTVSQVYRVSPAAVFDTPRTVTIPLSSNATADAVTVFYFSESTSHLGWYAADEVTGFTIPGSLRIETVGGVPHAVFEILHGGVVQIAKPARTSLSGFGLTLEVQGGRSAIAGFAVVLSGVLFALWVLLLYRPLGARR